ncbi:hypothetical protein cyc_08075 [Cyclospora cayetanensis]|uniref:Uncharacterized protein n=1 Tax=Cyclospora cayetanensis TaxID=88456 RepID=A0A1D3CX52_9EIME|nr:hypothetical protein cyc_08075 [Cyclospora cayetanensis]
MDAFLRQNVIRRQFVFRYPGRLSLPVEVWCRMHGVCEALTCKGSKDSPIAVAGIQENAVHIVFGRSDAEAEGVCWLEDPLVAVSVNIVKLFLIAKQLEAPQVPLKGASLFSTELLLLLTTAKSACS